jgi:hypothetical protein
VVSEQIWAALIAVAGTLAWISLAAFAFGMSTSWLRQDRLKVELVANALDKKSRGTWVSLREFLSATGGATRPRSRRRRDTSSCWNG